MNEENQTALTVYTENKKNDSLEVRFSIRAKLVMIISILVLVSLGSITVLVSYMVQQDLRVTAEANNYEVNRRTAILVENTLTAIRSTSLVFIRTLNYSGESKPAEAARIFFEENPQIAALYFTRAGQAGRSFVNELFFRSREIETSLSDSWFEKHSDILSRSSAVQTMILNAADDFAIPMLAQIFAYQDSSGQDGGRAAVLFSSESLSDAISSGTNQSYMVNGEGDILIHADFDLVRAGVNVANQSFIQTVRSSTQSSLQTLYTDNEGQRHFGAFTKLDLGASALVTSIAYDKVFEGLAETTRRNIYLTIAVLSFSIMFIWFFAKSISLPLRTLARAAQTIEGGSFELSLKPKGRDEIGVLTNSFQHMGAALNIFGRFTNKDLAVRAMRGELRPGGLPKHATIFFSDIRGFTEKTEIMTKEFGKEASDKVVFWLNNYLSRMVECVEKTGGVVDKFIGDAVMAHWGTAYTSGNPRQDAINCIKAALMMRLELVKINRKRMPGDKGNPVISIGCGINTGIVTAGQIGSDLRMEYTVIGDPVNLASRVESLNKPLGTDILISEDTLHLVKDHVITEEMPPVEVKGKEKPVRIFAVVNLKSSSRGPRTLAEVRRLMGITPVDISNVVLDAEEIKYKIGANKAPAAGPARLTNDSSLGFGR